MLKRFPLFVTLLAGLAVAGCKKDDDKQVTPANTTDFVATLSGGQQVPSNSSTATGTLTATLNRDTKKLTYKVTLTGLTPISAHIHVAAPGRAGGVKVPFNDLTSPIEGEADVDQATIDSLLAGRAYVNIHTTAFPNGEIRGNIRPKSTEFTAPITGAQQVPATSSTATGTFSGTYNAETKILKYNVTFTGITPISAHIHTAAPGRTGGVKVPFNSLASPIVGEQELDQLTADSLFANHAYVNMHSTAFPGGEIRGNIRIK